MILSLAHRFNLHEMLLEEVAEVLIELNTYKLGGGRRVLRNMASSSADWCYHCGLRLLYTGAVVIHVTSGWSQGA